MYPGVPSVLGDYKATHTMQPTIPADVPGVLDSCTSCHDDLSPSYMRRFIEQTQDKVANRLAVAQDTMAAQADVRDWVAEALRFVERDGSLGIHNYAYTDALLDAAELDMQLREDYGAEVFAVVSVVFTLEGNPKIIALDRRACQRG